MLKSIVLIAINLALTFPKNNDISGKIWKWNTNIFHKNNWETVKNCYESKMIFSPKNTAPIFLEEKQIISEIQLPENGQIILMENTTLEFRENYPGKCRKFKSINYHEWYNPENWLNNNNPATPDFERLPCDYDDVYLPSLLNSGISINEENEENLQLHSLFINGGKLRNSGELRKFLDSDLGKEAIFRNFPDKFQIDFNDNRKCLDRTGCVCHKTSSQIFCDSGNFPVNDNVNCETPLLPIGFCHQICGVYLHFRLGKMAEFNMAEYKKQLLGAIEDKKTHFHISKVTDEFNNDLIQIVLKEENYEGNSIILGQKIYQQLLKDNNNNNDNTFEFVHIYTSGNAVFPKRHSIVFLIFGTLFGVLFVFAVIFYVFDDKWRKFHYLPRRNRPFLAYFNNKEDKLIINESLQGSVISLEKSFDNPMYEHQSTSTNVETEYKNPLHDIKLGNESEE